MSTITPAEARFTDQRKAIAAQLGELCSLIKELPIFTAHHDDADGQPCAWDDATVVTTGLEQWCHLHRHDMIARTDGWDDMGDMDGPEFIECECGRFFASPPDMPWS